MKIRRAAFCAALAIAPILVPSPPVAEAGSGLGTFDWASAGYTVSSSSYQYSNMSGFVQAIVNSNGCSLTVDGVFGYLTTWWLAVAQNGIIGSNNGGVMNAWSWTGFQTASDPYGQPRLSAAIYIDGYGTQHRSYYGGGSAEAWLGWNPFSTQWLFTQYPSSSPDLLVPATPSRTISGVAACA